VGPAGYRFWELLDQVVQEEPGDSLDEVMLGFFQSVGIQKGKPFAPDERMKKILTEAAAVGDATARAIAFHTRNRDAYYYANSNWQLPFIGATSSRRCRARSISMARLSITSWRPA
jgi:hypothetical protein